MKTTLYIQNLKCGGCGATIINKLSTLEHIANVSIKLKYATVTFKHENKVDVEKVKQMLSKMGYPPFGEKNNLGKRAKSYVGCATGKIKT